MEIKQKILQGWNNFKKISSSLKILQPPIKNQMVHPLADRALEKATLDSGKLDVGLVSAGYNGV